MMKSPSRSVGIMESEGMRNGSKTKERSRRSTAQASSTGNAPYSALISGASGTVCRPEAITRRGRSSQSSTIHISVTGSASHDRRTMSGISVSNMGTLRSSALVFAAYLQNRQKRFLRNLDVSQLLHAFLAFLLFLEQLAFAGHVAAIAFCEHVLAQCLDGGTGDDRAADGRLHRDLEHLPRDELVHLVHQLAAALVGAVAVHNDRQRIHLVAVD